MQGAARFFPKRASTVKPLNAAHRATLRMWQRLQHINANAASSTLTDADASQLREAGHVAQTGCHPCTQAASPGIPGRSGRGLQKRRRLPGPQDPEKAPPMGAPNTGTAAKLGGLTSHTTGRVDHAGDARHKDFCEVPTIEPHSSFAARHDRRATWQTHRQYPPAQGRTHWVCPSGGQRRPGSCALPQPEPAWLRI